MPVGDELMHRHQFDRSNAQVLEVIDDRRTAETGVGAAQLGRHLRVKFRIPFHMQLIDDRLVPWCIRRRVVAPAKRRIYDDALGHPACAILIIDGKIGFGISDRITEQSIAPLNAACNGFGVGIQ